MASPLVSIIICAFDAGPDLRESVVSALAQTHREMEVLVVDDGSTDGSVDSLDDIRRRDGRLRIYRQANAGKSVAMNLALRELRGEFYAIQDADDLSHPRRVERQLARLVAEPDLAAVFTGHELLLGQRRVAPRFREKGPADCREDIDRFRMPAHDPTVMYRVSLVRDFQYDPTLRIGQGFDHILRVGERLPMSVLGECLYSYRVNWDSVTRRNSDVRDGYVKRVLAKARERRGLADEPAAVPDGGDRHGNARRDNNMAAHFMESVLDQRRAGMRCSAVRTALDCAKLHPLDPHYYKAVVYSVAPEMIISRIRRSTR